jgi:hypothetical protein
MITRFRIEGEGQDKEELMDEIVSVVGVTIGYLGGMRVKNGEPVDGEWECTQDVITGSPGAYRGRMVMKYHPEGSNAS